MSQVKKVELSKSTKRYLTSLENSGKPPLHAYPPAKARELYKRNSPAVTVDAPPIGSTEDRILAGPHGPFAIRIYRPLGSKPEEILPVLIFFHGGGWMVGDLDTHDALCRLIANQSEACVIAVDYHLSPEVKFPVAIEESIFATRWISENAADLKVDPKRIAVGGDSAGGNISAVICLDSVLHNGPSLVYQVLIYPSVDQNGNYPSYEENRIGYYLDESLLTFFRDNYLDAKDFSDWRASPIKAKSFVGLPPALIITAGYDPLRDEAKDYADRLQAAGVPVTYTCYEDMIHGFSRIGRVIPEAQKSIDEVASALKKVFRKA